MDVILRVSGKNLRLADVAALISAAPYRTDRAGEDRYTVNCLHWLVASLNGDYFSNMMERASDWLADHPELSALKSRQDVGAIDLDIGVTVADDFFAVSYRLDHRLVEAATAIGASATLSVYRTDEEADRPNA